MPSLTTATTRKTADERRVEVLAAAAAEFATHGWAGASTERIASAAMLSQPYVFRLFGTRQALLLQVVADCFERTTALFERAAGDRRGDAAKEAIGAHYAEMVERDPVLLNCQLQAYAACAHEPMREAVQAGFGRLVDTTVRLTGLEHEDLAAFFAHGMLINVVTAMRLPASPRPWAQDLAACAVQPLDP